MNDKLSFSLKSMMDDFGRVFFYNNKVYRAIHPNKEEFCRKLLQSELFRQLSDSGVVPHTILAELNVEGYNTVLEHEKLLEIHQHEWSFDMLKDASLMVVELNEICLKYGYELKDAHTLNVLFRGTRPVYVDIGSIVPKGLKSNSWSAYEEFLGSFVMPLIFWSKGFIFITRKLLESNFHRLFTLPNQSFNQSGLLRLLTGNGENFDFKIRHLKIIRTKTNLSVLNTFVAKANGLAKKLSGKPINLFSYQLSNQYQSLSDFFGDEPIAKTILNLEYASINSTWKGYHSKFYKSGSGINYSKRFLRIAELIKRNIEIRSVIDLAGNEGFFCSLLLENNDLDKIISTDYDENAINTAYRNFRSFKNSTIHTALLNFMFTPNLIETGKRLKCDLVLALAVTHHLILKNGFSIDAIFERLSLFTNRYVMVEFMPLGLWAADQVVPPEVPPYYTVEWFRTRFHSYFELILEEQLEENRILFFGRLK